MLFDVLVRLLAKRSGWYSVGSFASRWMHEGVDWTDIRKYTFGTSKKYIHRKITAKYDDLFISRFVQENAVYVDIFLDLNYNWTERYASIFDSFEYLEYLSSRYGMKLSWYFYDTISMPRILRIHRHHFATIRGLLQQIITSYVATYTSYISLFLSEYMHHKKSYHVLRLFSDFLSLSQKHYPFLRYLCTANKIVFSPIYVDPYEGRNYIYSPQIVLPFFCYPFIFPLQG